MSSCSNLCGSKQTRAAAEGGYQRYGVRSYLHQFYEDCTTSIWEYEDDFQIQRSPNRWSSVFWKVLYYHMVASATTNFFQCLQLLPYAKLCDMVPPTPRHLLLQPRQQTSL
ncbi:neurensin 1 [Phyllostomus discolor]|uniref:Neurensin 1 n=1 Tax=Phyllostomus discolor TaxID=89673 RepID=A0A834A986_9CHIR|nr:neurensin 1 [Phyllostomus discolor]